MRNSMSPVTLVCFAIVAALIVDLRLGAEDVIEAAGAGGSALENVGDPAQGDHGPDEQSEIGVEGDQRA